MSLVKVFCFKTKNDLKLFGEDARIDFVELFIYAM